MNSIRCRHNDVSYHSNYWLIAVNNHYILCALLEMCYACGDVEAASYVDPSKCAIPTEGANSTDTTAELIPCYSGVCYVSAHQM